MSLALSSSKRPSVLVILASFQGSNYILEQLSTLSSQLSVDISLVISDDDSTDSTLLLAQHYCSSMSIPLTSYSNRPASGSACINFLSTIHRIDQLDFDYYALCDQDDIWLPSKLIQAISSMKANYADGYSSALVPFQITPKTSFSVFLKNNPPLSFLVQSASAGCTYVLSRSAFLSLQESLDNLIKKNGRVNIFSHDIYIHQVVRTCGFRWYYDQQSYILYRQHANNDWGVRSNSVISIIRRIVPLFNGVFFDSLVCAHESSAYSTPELGSRTLSKRYSCFVSWLLKPSVATFLRAIPSTLDIYYEPQRRFIFVLSMFYRTFQSLFLR